MVFGMIHVVGKFNKNKEYLQDICELNILESITCHYYINKNVAQDCFDRHLIFSLAFRFPEEIILYILIY